MTTPFFSTPARLAALTTEAERWIGTPFINYGAVCGKTGGASCHCLAQAILAGAGFFVDEQLPRVRVTWARHHTGGLMIPWLRARGTIFAEITPMKAESIWAGDLLVANLNELCENHSGVAVQRNGVPGLSVVHTLRGQGAHYTGLGDTAFKSVLAAIFRPLDTSRTDFSNHLPTVAHTP
jgi:hypothetical protein